MLPLLLIIVACVVGAMAVDQTRRRRRYRTMMDDALKIIAAARMEGRDVRSTGLAGAMNVDLERAVAIIDQLHDDGLAIRHESGVRLTDSGERRALMLLRAHRLIERYLADEVGMPLTGIHQRADRLEHRMTAEQIAELNEYLGHPDRDPHGDPIPALGGRFDHVPRVPLNDWPTDRPATVVHVEDEPPGRMKRVLDAGVQPGVVLRIVKRTHNRLKLRIGEQDTALSVAAGDCVHVVAPGGETDQAAAPVTLRQLPIGDEATIIAISDRCRGLTRRRLLDLGLTPGATVRAELANAGRSAVAYRVRGTLIALRREQADHVLIGEA
jgi:DtxR family Mn-dependent transcriptional regulator